MYSTFPPTIVYSTFVPRIESGAVRMMSRDNTTTSASMPPVTVPSLHCEVEPWASAELVAAFRTLRIGDRVRVTGRWGFDGVHTGRPEWVEVLLAVVRHMPNVREGWFECHPVERIERL